MKKIDFLSHFTFSLDALENILIEGFKPSYAKEKMGNEDILVPMVSFSNILLRDIGKEEVIDYGDYALGFNREWGIKNELNPVIYTYDDGSLANAIHEFIGNSVLLSAINDFKTYLERFSKTKMKFSDHINVTNTSKETIAILDYFSLNYKPEYDPILNLISNLALTIHDYNLPILQLTKPYLVNKEDKQFVAYNDREWRKLTNLNFVSERSNEYKKWIDTPKPHIIEEKYRLSFKILDLKFIMISKNDEINNINNTLESLIGKEKLNEILTDGSLTIGTRDFLMEKGF